MKPKLPHKIPLQPNLSASQAMAYIEHYRYLEHYNFGPYYIDSLALKGVRLLCMEHVDATFKIKNRPLLKSYVNRWYPDRNFFPPNASHFIWATYERISVNEDGTIKYNQHEGSLHELLEKHKMVVNIEYIQSAEDAKKLVERFNYIVNNCLVIPGNYIVTGLLIINLLEVADTAAQTIRMFVKNNHHKGLIKPDSFAVIATVSRNAADSGYEDVQQWFLCDLLEQYKIKVINKEE